MKRFFDFALGSVICIMLMTVVALSSRGDVQTIDLPASTQHSNPDCTCENCECDPCECNVSLPSTDSVDVSPKPENIDTRNWVYVFTTDNCPPCDYMKQTELPRLKAAGHRVIFMLEGDPRFAKFYEYYRPSGGFPQVIVVDHAGAVVKRFKPGRVVTEQISGQSVLEKVTTLPAMQTKPTQVYAPQRTGLFRGRYVRSCGPGGCR